MITIMLGTTYEAYEYTHETTGLELNVHTAEEAMEIIKFALKFNLDFFLENN